MVHSVAVLAPNGAVGSVLVRHLIDSHRSGKIHLVLLHRPDRPPKNIPGDANLETRVIDLEDGDEETISNSVKGIDVFVSAIAAESLPLEVRLVEALAKSKDIKYFIPSKYGRPWGPEEANDPERAPWVRFINASTYKAQELGLKVVTVGCGYFENYLFERSYLGPKLKANVIQANSHQMKNKLPVTTIDYIGAALGTIALRAPESITASHYSAVQFWVSGEEFVELFTKLHNGAKPKIRDFTEEDFRAMTAAYGEFGIAVSSYMLSWEKNDWKFENAIDVEKREPELLEDVARRFI